MDASEIFVSRPGPHPMIARSSAPRGRWLKFFNRLQDLLLIAYISFVCFLPQNLNSLVWFFMLLPVWGFMSVVGVWHLLKVPGHRRQAAWAIGAFPLAIFLLWVLGSTVGVPITESGFGTYLFIGTLCVFPLYWLGRWLLRSTEPQPTKPVRARVTTFIILAVVLMLMLQALFLVWMLFNADAFGSFRSWFGGDWYVTLLWATLGTTVVVSIAAVPFVILSLVRGTEHKGTMIAILACITVAVICPVGILGLFAALSYG